MTTRINIALRIFLASGILGTLSIYAANSLRFTFWLLFLIIFTFSVLIFTRLIEMWTVIPTFISGKLWIYGLGSDFNVIGIIVLTFSFLLLFFAELKRLNLVKAEIRRVEHER